MDFMQNISFPGIPVQESFYLRQLAVNVFCIHDIKQNKSVIYIYHEGQARKGPDETCSFLKHYLDNVTSKHDELHIYSDNCPAQNKNHCVSKFLNALADTKQFKKFHSFFL